MPVLEQVAASSVGHSLSGSVPVGTALQRPVAPAWLHFSQVPLQRDWQHRPSVQKLVAHSASAVHVWPRARLQTLETHVKPLWHSVLVAHDGWQRPVVVLQV